MAFNFKKTEVAKGATFLTPGVYPMTPIKVELGEFPQKHTPFLAVTFQNEDGQSITEKFVLSEKAIGRLQYLHQAFFGKLCEAEFPDEDAVLDYFKKALTGKKKFTKNIIVGGEISGSNVYASLPFTDFVDVDGDFEVGEFEEGSEEWKKYVKKRVGDNSGITSKGNGILNGGDDDDDGDDDKPAKPAKTKEKEKEKAAPAKNNKKAKEEEPEEAGDDDDDDMPW